MHIEEVIILIFDAAFRVWVGPQGPFRSPIAWQWCRVMGSSGDFVLYIYWLAWLVLVTAQATCAMPGTIW